MHTQVHTQKRENTYIGTNIQKDVYTYPDTHTSMHIHVDTDA